MRCKHETEERNLRLTREKADLTSSLAENEEELQEVMRRYKACVGAVSTDQITIQVRIYLSRKFKFNYAFFFIYFIIKLSNGTNQK